MVRFLFFLPLISLLIIFGCAKELAPSGGPKDVAPPMAVRMKPPMNTTNFDNNKVVITFNEYINLANPEQHVSISPPLNNKPSIKLKGKSIHITLNDTLKENTTYNINFNDVVRDYTEGNIAKQFQYVFSTGNELDTIFVNGKVVDAATGNPLNNIQVGLYTQHTDSVVSIEKPNFYGVTNKEGEFFIYNIRKAEYRIFAISDIGNNMIYDLPNESVAFSSKTIIPETYRDIAYDTLKIIKEINETNGDTLFRDSLMAKEVILSNIGEFKLGMFTPHVFNPFVKESKRMHRYLVNVVMNQELDTAPKLTTFDGNNFISLISDRPDSLLYFVPDTTVAQRDTIKALFSYYGVDTLKNRMLKTDTLTFISAKEINKLDTIVEITTNIKSGALEINMPLELYFSHPVEKLNAEMLMLTQIDDTVRTRIPISLIMDLSNTKTVVEHEYNPDFQYEIKLDSLAIEDIFGLHSMPTKYSFVIRNESEYGVLALNISGTLPEGSIIELLDTNSKIQWRAEYPTTNSIVAKDIKPGKYQLRLLIDSNKNGVWDTGDYYKNQQPEEVIPYTKNVILRANWDTEIVWNLELNR